VSFTKTLQLAPLLVIGAVLGFWLNKRMNDQLFSKIVYGVTFVLGGYLLVDAIRSLIVMWG
jgi:uncharacterized membrane protein YfcA